MKEEIAVEDIAASAKLKNGLVATS